MIGFRDATEPSVTIMKKNFVLPICALLFLTFATPGLAAKRDKDPFLAAEDNACRVLKPDAFPEFWTTPETPYFVRYTGRCKNGYAHGRGRAEWFSRYPDVRPYSSLEGVFLHGVFLNEQKVEDLELVPERNWVHVSPGRVDGNKLWWDVRLDDNGSFDLCDTYEVYVETKADVSFEDDAAVQTIMRKVGANYFKMCPNSRYINTGAPIILFRQGDKPANLQDLKSSNVVQAFYEPRNADLQRGSYKNPITEKLQLAREKKEKDAAKAAKRKQLETFARKNDIKAWLTLHQLYENPYKWEGKTIGTIVSLSRMITRDSAWVETDADWGWFWRYALIKLKGITPDFPDSSYTVVIAAKVREEEKKPETDKDKDKEEEKYRHYLDFVDLMVCESNHCDDFTSAFDSKDGVGLKWDEELR